MRILVVDLEATCWEREPPAGMQSDIIEVGWAVLETVPGGDYEILDAHSTLIKPLRSTVSQYCEELTGISHKAVEDCDTTLEVAIEMMKDSQATCWASWGDYDYLKLIEQTNALGIKLDMPRAHLNAKALFSAFYRRRRMGLGKALKELGMVFEGKPHRAKDDAVNTAKILARILNGG